VQRNAVGAANEEVIYAQEFGAVGDGKTDDGPAIREALVAAREVGAGCRLVLGPKTYRLLPQAPGACCLPVFGQDRFVLDGQGAKLVIGDPRASVVLFLRCTDSTARDFSIDYDPLPFTWGVITGVNAAEGWFDLQLAEGQPSLEESFFLTSDNRWGMVYDATRRIVKPGARDHMMIERWEKLGAGERTFRMFAEEKYREMLPKLAPGDRFVHLARNKGSDALSFIECVRCLVEDVVIHSSPGLAAGSAHCDAMTFRRFQVRHKPGEQRLLTTDADGVHCHQNLSGPLIEDCFFEGMADDSLNIYSPPSVVLEVLSPTEMIVTRSARIRRGHRVQILDPQTGRIRATVRVVVARPIAQARFRLVVDPPVPDVHAGTDSTNGDTLYDLDVSGEGYIIRNNTMREYRGRGMLLQAGRGLVEGNRLEDICDPGIVITHSPGWPEGPVPSDVTVRNNTLVGLAYAGNGAYYGDGAIRVCGEKYPYNVADAREVHGIRIEGNTIQRWGASAIAVCAARDVVIRDNTLVDEPPLGPVAVPPVGIYLENCAEVTVDGLHIKPSRPELAGAVRIGPKVEQSSLVVRNVTFEGGSGIPVVAPEK